MDKRRIDKLAWWIPNKKLRAFFRDFCNEHNQLLEDNKKLNAKIASMNNFSINLIEELHHALSFGINNKKILNTFSIYNNKELYNYMFFLWYYCYDDVQLIKIFDILSERSNIWSINNNFWLIYISLLYQNNEIDKAKNLLLQYIEKFNLLNIHRFLLVSELAFSLNIVNEDIERSIFIKNKLDKSIDDNILENTIKGKSVAVVGNGPHEIGKGNGKEIDSHDIVIRFNNFQLEGFENDYGSKTNIWFNNRVEKDISNINKYLLYIGDYDYTKMILNDYVLNLLYDLFCKYSNITYIGRKSIIEISKQECPTSGLMCLLKIKEIKNKYNEKFDVNNIYGFSFLYDDKTEHSLKHYYGDISKEISDSEVQRLKFDSEIEFLRKLFRPDQTRPDQTRPDQTRPDLINIICSDYIYFYNNLKYKKIQPMLQYKIAA